MTKSGAFEVGWPEKDGSAEIGQYLEDNDTTDCRS